MNVLRLEQGDRMRAPAVVCLGFFDGVHIGHAQLILRARAVAAEQNLQSCVHTFDEMPARVVNPRDNTLELTPLAEKIRLIAAMGIDAVAVSTFRKAMGMSAEAFFQEVLLDRLCARHIVAGFHHRFGHQGKGDVALLQALCAASGTGLDIITPVRLADGALVSSTAIRQALRSGDLTTASRMLGRDARDTLTAMNRGDPFHG